MKSVDESNTIFSILDTVDQSNISILKSLEQPFLFASKDALNNLALEVKSVQNSVLELGKADYKERNFAIFKENFTHLLQVLYGVSEINVKPLIEATRALFSKIKNSAL